MLPNHCNQQTWLFIFQDRASTESKLLQEVSSVKDRNLHLETKADELDGRCQHQQDQIYELKEELASSHAQTKLQATQAEGWCGFGRLKKSSTESLSYRI